MGYTHCFYFEKFIGDKFDNNLLKDVKKVIKKYSSILRYEIGSTEMPIVNDSLIYFNGINEDNGYETFILEPTALDFTFCKTARRGYDLPVCEILLLFKFYYKNNFYLDSDGFDFDKDGFDFKIDKYDCSWKEAFKNIEEMFGYTFNNIEFKGSKAI
ncbi:TPA: hypothetical protein N2D16_002841 [Clostridium botulinum]|nr:hypothetical protein [Clostridium botulinum]HCL4455217.1 hypothetical protein [Clostridium botulinum]